METRAEMDTAFVYSLMVYFFYHLIAESTILSAPRAWVTRVAPPWMTYPLRCPLCFTWWVGALTTLAFRWNTDIWVFDPLTLFIAPVINMFLGLLADYLKTKSSSS
jgi:hypothetical protein